MLAQVHGSLPPMREIRTGLPALSCAQPSSACWGHLRSQTADSRVFASLPLCSFSLAVFAIQSLRQIKKQILNMFKMINLRILLSTCTDRTLKVTIQWAVIEDRSPLHAVWKLRSRWLTLHSSQHWSGNSLRERSGWIHELATWH